jgi:MoaA/NifB/PqqE/SkfB family radical SAM enzyme
MELSFYNPSKALLYIKDIEEGNVIFFDIHPTNRCNHDCVWCKFEHDEKKMTYDEMMSFVDKHPTVQGIRISGGGEPLVNPDTIPFIEECVARGKTVGIFTNGGLLNDENIKTITKCRFCRISLDAATPETHEKLHRSKDFYRVLENIVKLARSGIRELGVSFMVTADNVENIPQLPLLNLPVDYMHFKPINRGIDEDVKKKALHYLKVMENSHERPSIRYSRVLYDQWANRRIPCRITKIIRAIASDKEEYVCCEHHYEQQYNAKVWDGDNSQCCNCVYNAYNEILDMYYTNAISKEFF